jgi:hypothetical protein
VDQSAPVFGDKARAVSGSSDPSFASPQANWVNQQLLDNAAGTTVQPVTVTDPGNLFADMTDEQVATMQQVVDGFQNQIVGDFDTLDWGGMLDLMLPLLGAGVIEIVRQVAVLFLNALTGTVESFRDLTVARWDIPVLTWIYEDVICDDDGSELSLIDLAALLAAVPMTVTAKAITGEKPFTDEVANTVLGSQTWDEMVAALAALDASLPGSQNPSAALTVGASFLLAGGLARICSVLVDAAGKTERMVKSEADVLKSMCDWTTFFLSLINASMVSSVRSPDTDRMRLDWAMVVLQVLPCIRASFQIAYPLPSIDANGVAILEVGVGCFMLVGVCWSIGLEWQEPVPPPPPNTSLEQWHTLIAFKFVTNCSAAINSIMAFEDAMGENDDGKAEFEAMRFVVQLIEACMATFLGGAAVLDRTSDVG